jgi:tetratricopeptide (TPR) repeat protein
VAAVVQICARLDGLPLAIELAAPRVKLFSPQAILTRLDNRLALLTGGARDLPARQQTLRGAIEWGYDLLDPAEKTLFAQLAVFVGGFTLEAIDVIIGNWLLDGKEPQYPILDSVASLVDNSLLRQEEGLDGEPRFRMLETIRDYALERLVESGTADALKRRHVAYYLAWAETARPHLKGWQQMGWLDRLEAEHDNLRAAFTTLLAWGEIETALRLGAALWPFWLLRGYLSEGIKWLEKIIDHWRLGTQDFLHYPLPTTHYPLPAPHAPLPTSPAHVLHGAGVLHCERGQCANAESLLRQSLALFQAAGDTPGAAYSRNDLGFALLSQGNYAEAIALCQESLASFRPLGDTWGTAAALNNLGLAALSQGDAAQTTQLCQESLALFQKLGDRWGMALALNNLGLAALPQGDYERATWLCEQSLVLFRELGGKP